MPNDSGRIGSLVTGAFLDAIGGPEQLGKDIAAHLEDARGHAKTLMFGKGLQLIENEDKARSRQQELEFVGQQQERAILLEHSLYMMESDDGYLMKALEVGLKRDGVEFLRRVSEMARQILPESETRLLGVE